MDYLIKRGKLFHFLGAGMFLINAVIFFANSSVPATLGVGSIFVAIAIVVLSLLPWVRIVFNVVAVAVSFFSAYLLTNSVRQMPRVVVVPSNMLVFLGFVLVVAGGILETRYGRDLPSRTKKHKTKTEKTEKTAKVAKTKTLKVKKKKAEYIPPPPPPPQYDLIPELKYEPEVVAFIEYLKGKESRLLEDIGRANIRASLTKINVASNFDIDNYKPNREIVTPTFFVNLMRWVTRQYKFEHKGEVKQLITPDFAMSIESVWKKNRFVKKVVQLSIDNNSVHAVARSLIEDDLKKQDKQFYTKWPTTLYYSDRYYYKYKEDKEIYEYNCNKLKLTAYKFVEERYFEIIKPIAERLYNSLNIYYQDISGNRYLTEEIVVASRTLEGSGLFAKSSSRYFE